MNNRLGIAWRITGTFSDILYGSGCQPQVVSYICPCLVLNRKHTCPPCPLTKSLELQMSADMCVSGLTPAAAAAATALGMSSYCFCYCSLLPSLPLTAAAALRVGLAVASGTGRWRRRPLRQQQPRAVREQTCVSLTSH